jgi:hypothetical protein
MIVGDIPAYDLGYLLRKLPQPYSIMAYSTGRLVAVQGEVTATADTPEDAAAKLAIELFKQGILTRSES